MTTVPIARANGIDICYETIGDPSDPTVLLIMGLGGQMLGWDLEFCESLADRGFHVIRFDNRDVGLSTKIQTDDRLDFHALVARALAGQEIDAPYLLSDMAADACGLLDALGIETAHLVGVSMGGMIAQTIAIEHPERVQTLTSIMSTTGELDVGLPSADALALLMSEPARSLEEYVDGAVAASRVVGSPDHIDEDRVRRRARALWERGYFPVGTGRQLIAVAASGSRAEKLRQLAVPTLVIHGSVDPLVDPSGGERTAELVPGAELLLLEGMGHDLPPAFWPRIIEAITRHAAANAPAR